MKNYVKVAKVNDIPVGGSKGLEASGKRIALFNIDGQYFALSNDCNHKGGPLSEGSIEGEKVTCPWHGAAFDIKTGKNLCPPAAGPIDTFKVQVVGDDIEVEV